MDRNELEGYIETFNGERYIQLREAAMVTGMPRRTFDDRIRASGIDVYYHPRSRRIRMIRASDLEKLVPVEVARRPARPFAGRGSRVR